MTDTTTVVEEIILVKVDITANGNKFYAFTLHNDDTVTCRYGRVGAARSTHTYIGGKTEFDRLLREKERKGYAQVKVVSSLQQTGGKGDLLQIAKTVLVGTQHSGNSQVNDLIERLVKINRHEIITTSGGLIQINSTGQISTPLSILRGTSLDSAKRVLDGISLKSVHDVSRNDLIEQYLRLVPQKMPAKVGWQQDFLTDDDAIQEQVTFLD